MGCGTVEATLWVELWLLDCATCISHVIMERAGNNVGVYGYRLVSSRSVLEHGSHFRSHDGQNLSG